MYNQQLTITLHDGGRLVLCATTSERNYDLGQMGSLMSLPIEDRKPETMDAELVSTKVMPEGRHTMWKTALTEIAFTEDWDHVLIEGWRKKPAHAMLHRHYVWQMSLIWGSLNALLKGRDAILVHCSVLETERGAVLLFGESGMGKSTASARWRALGGKCISDDMALLDFSGGDEIRVRRMPTWSACREGKNEWNYPAGRELPLVYVLALGRSETGRDEIVELSPAQYFAQCYRSMFYWYTLNTKSLPDDMKACLANRIRQFTERITGKNPPRALLTVLEGPELRRVVESYLEGHGEQ